MQKSVSLGIQISAFAGHEYCTFLHSVARASLHNFYELIPHFWESKQILWWKNFGNQWPLVSVYQTIVWRVKQFSRVQFNGVKNFRVCQICFGVSNIFLEAFVRILGSPQPLQLHELLNRHHRTFYITLVELLTHCYSTFPSSDNVL